MAAMQDLIGASGKASVFYLKLGGPSNAEDVVAAVKNQPGMENIRCAPCRST
jgi:hypothetical protein